MSDATAPTKTVQFRRYEIVAGELDAFVEWWQARLVAARTALGFTIEFAYAVRETNEFVWAVSAPGDRAAFEQIDAAYMASDARAEAFAGVPTRAAAQHVSIVDSVVV
ncbi:hypothetical protein [Subtercola lobariae]|uniref:NIPSNAP domain-containing protein n=1 Tax=Subtercola lobariae TaxID=1588641 RepID=A0A917B142_9MICO|nr:hypothetical protein [Subtercola lobariae]GGF12458.1 hypothetical protein GCM10011399_03000 [Subtercola lobariae]